MPMVLAARDQEEADPSGRLYAFRPNRMFWGTDITRMSCSWRQCVTVFTDELPWLQRRDLEVVMGETLCDWAGWRLPG